MTGILSDVFANILLVFNNAQYMILFVFSLIFIISLVVVVFVVYNMIKHACTIKISVGNIMLFVLLVTFVWSCLDESTQINLEKEIKKFFYVYFDLFKIGKCYVEDILEHIKYIVVQR